MERTDVVSLLFNRQKQTAPLQQLPRERELRRPGPVYIVERLLLEHINKQPEGALLSSGPESYDSRPSYLSPDITQAKICNDLKC